MTASPGSRLCAKPPKAREQVSAAKGMGAGARHGLRGIRGILMADFERDAEQLQSADFSDVEQFYLVVYWSRYVRDLFDAAVTHEKTTDEVELLNLMLRSLERASGCPPPR
jgi:hypothetical protein